MSEYNRMEFDDLTMGGISGITEESESKVFDMKINPKSGDWFEDLIAKQNEADYRCPACGNLSIKTGECSRCGAKWTPPLYH